MCADSERRGAFATPTVDAIAHHRRQHRRRPHGGSGILRDRFSWDRPERGAHCRTRPPLRAEHHHSSESQESDRILAASLSCRTNEIARTLPPGTQYCHITETHSSAASLEQNSPAYRWIVHFQAAAVAPTSCQTSKRSACERRSKTGSGSFSVIDLNVSVAEEYSFAEQVESSTSVHLPVEHLDPSVESDHADDRVLLWVDHGTEETI